MRLRCSNLGVSFKANGQTVRALRDISFETREGEFLSIIGPSGCGKTTLLRTLAGLIHPDEGTIEHGAVAGGRFMVIPNATERRQYWFKRLTPEGFFRAVLKATRGFTQ